MSTFPTESKRAPNSDDEETTTVAPAASSKNCSASVANPLDETMKADIAIYTSLFFKGEECEWHILEGLSAHAAYVTNHHGSGPGTGRITQNSLRDVSRAAVAAGVVKVRVAEARHWYSLVDQSAAPERSLVDALVSILTQNASERKPVLFLDRFDLGRIFVSLTGARIRGQFLQTVNAAIAQDAVYSHKGYISLPCFATAVAAFTNSAPPPTYSSALPAATATVTESKTAPDDDNNNNGESQRTQSSASASLPPSPPPAASENSSVAALVKIVREQAKSAHRLCVTRGVACQVYSETVTGGMSFAGALAEAEKNKLLVAFDAGGKDYVALREHADTAITVLSQQQQQQQQQQPPATHPMRPPPAYAHAATHQELLTKIQERDETIIFLRQALGGGDLLLSQERKTVALQRKQIEALEAEVQRPSFSSRAKETEEKDAATQRAEQLAVAAAAQLEECKRKHAEEMRSLRESAEREREIAASEFEQQLEESQGTIEALRQKLRQQQLEMQRTRGDAEINERDLKIAELAAHVRSLKVALAQQQSSPAQCEPSPLPAADSEPAKKRRKKKTTSVEPEAAESVPAAAAAAVAPRTVAGVVLATNPEARKRQLGAKLRLWAVEFESRCGRAPGDVDVAGDADASAWTKELERCK